MAGPLVALLEQSDGFAAAKSRMSLMEEVEYWGGALTHRVRVAAQSNSQVRRAFGVTARIDSLVAPMKGDADGYGSEPGATLPPTFREASDGEL